jgi:hypothetical protein
MPAAIGPRFVLEAGFLVLLAVVVGIADLDPLLIVLVMLVGWLLVSLIEYFAWRQTQGAALRRLDPAPVAVMEDEVVEDIAPPPPPPPPPEPAPAVDEDTIVPPAAAERPTEPMADEPEAPKDAPVEQPAGFMAPTERRMAHRLEPLRPRPRRRWILFGRHDRRESPVEDDRDEER